MKYISGRGEQHQTPEDVKEIQDIFQMFAGESKKLSKDDAQLAYEKVFEKWDIDLTGSQETAFEKDKFFSTWKQFCTKEFPDTDLDSLKLEDAVPFIRELASLSTDDRRKQESFVQKKKPEDDRPIVPERYERASLKDL